MYENDENKKSLTTLKHKVLTERENKANDLLNKNNNNSTGRFNLCKKNTLCSQLNIENGMNIYSVKGNDSLQKKSIPLIEENHSEIKKEFELNRYKPKTERIYYKKKSQSITQDDNSLKEKGNGKLSSKVESSNKTGHNLKEALINKIRLTKALHIKLLEEIGIQNESKINPNLVKSENSLFKNTTKNKINKKNLCELTKSTYFNNSSSNGNYLNFLAKPNTTKNIKTEKSLDFLQINSNSKLNKDKKEDKSKKEKENLYSKPGINYNKMVMNTSPGKDQSGGSNGESTALNTNRIKTKNNRPYNSIYYRKLLKNVKAINFASRILKTKKTYLLNINTTNKEN